MRTAAPSHSESFGSTLPCCQWAKGLAHVRSSHLLSRYMPDTPKGPLCKSLYKKAIAVHYINFGRATVLSLY